MRYLTAFCLSAMVSMAVSTVKAQQGDSDPGLGQVGAMRTGAALIVTEDDYENMKPHFSLGHTFSAGEKGVKYRIPQLELRLPIGLPDINSTGYVDVRLPIQNSYGDLGSKWGMGDLTVTYTHMLLADPTTWTIQATGGALFGMNTANVTDANSRPLPMSYQPGTGSTDIMVGASATFKEYFTVAVGYQQPVYRYNKNDYFRSSYDNDPVYSNAEYTIARNLHRYGDAMMRVEGHLVTNRVGLTAGAQGLYHVHDDVYEDRFRNIALPLKNSQGLTINLLANAFVRFGRYGAYKLDVTGTVPVVSRVLRPDGLERTWTVMPRLTFFFNQRTLLF